MWSCSFRILRSLLALVGHRAAVVWVRLANVLLHAAAVHQGDELLEVAGSSVMGKSPFEAASLIQGPKGTKVSIKV